MTRGARRHISHLGAQRRLDLAHVRHGFGIIDKPPVGRRRDHFQSRLAPRGGENFRWIDGGGRERKRDIVDFVESSIEAEAWGGPQPPEHIDEFTRAIVAGGIAIGQQIAAEGAKLRVVPAGDDIDRHAARTDAIKRRGELGDHDRMQQARMQGDHVADATRPRTDRARHDPCGEIGSQMTFGE